MGNKSTFKRKFNFWVGWISLISGICSIISFGALIYSWVHDLNITSYLMACIIRYFAYIPLLCCIFCLIMNHFIIPWYKVNKQDIPNEEAKPSYISSGILVITIVFYIVYILITPDINYAQDNSQITENSQSDNKTGEDIYKPYIENVNDPKENILTPFQQIIEEYVIKSYKEPISIEEWRTLSAEVLYYIRNGIFAYSHAKFEKDFYSVYSWYDGTIDINDFDWNVLNEYQRINIENILAVENEKNINNK